MVQEVGYIKQPSNQILKLFSMHLGTGKIERDLSETYGSPELMLPLENLEFPLSLIHI